MLNDLIKKKNIALVGPSSSLYGKKMGKLIDNYDIVIKINRFQDLELDDYGKRMDILFYSFFLGIPDNSIKLYNTKLIVGGHTFEKEDGRAFPENKKNLEISKNIYNDIIHEYYPKINNKEFYKYYNTDWTNKTTGFWVICFLFQKLDIIKQLNIFGLDFCFNKYNKIYNIT